MIAIVNNFHPFSGIGKYSFNLFEQLRRDGQNVKMLYLESKDNVLKEQMEGVKKIKQAGSLPVYNKTYSSYYYFPKKIPDGYDLYHFTSQFLARGCKFKKPSVVTHMDVAPLIFPKEYPLLMRKYFRKAMQHYKSAEAVFTISQAAKDELIEMKIVEEDKIYPIPLGFDQLIYKPGSKETARKELGIAPESKIILNIGSEEPRKNIPVLLQAAKKVSKNVEDLIVLRVGGTNKDYDEMKKGLNILHFNGIDEDKMPLFYQAADVFMFPATYEGGFAYPPIEAMACGNPTIVSDELKLFKKGVMIANASSADEFAAFAEKILLDKKENAKQSASALKEAQSFTLAKEAEEKLKVYKKVAKGI